MISIFFLDNISSSCSIQLSSSLTLLSLSLFLSLFFCLFLFSLTDYLSLSIFQYRKFSTPTSMSSFSSKTWWLPHFKRPLFVSFFLSFYILYLSKLISLSFIDQSISFFHLLISQMISFNWSLEWCLSFLLDNVSSSSFLLLSFFQPHSFIHSFIIYLFLSLSHFFLFYIFSLPPFSFKKHKIFCSHFHVFLWINNPINTTF